MLSDDQLEHLADLVAERLAAVAPTSGFIRVEQVAKMLNRSPNWVYAHKVELGALKLGSSQQAPLLFDAEEVRAWARAQRMDGRPPKRVRPPARRGPRRRSRIPEDELIPILPRDPLS